MAFPTRTATNNGDAFSAARNTASAAGITGLGGLSDTAVIALICANLLEGDPTTVNVPAGDVLSGTFGANKTGGADTGDYTFPAAAVFTTQLSGLTALATPSALVATTFAGFASTVSGATLMGFGTTNDVTLKNRAGTTVLGVTANTTGVTMAGALAITGALTGVTSATLSADLNVAAGFGIQNASARIITVNSGAAGGVNIAGPVAVTTNLISTTALATPGALAATQFTGFASTVSGAAIMGFGTTNDVALMNRAGTVVLGIGPNTTTVNLTGALTVATTSVLSGALTVNAASQLGTAAGADVTTIGGTGYGAGVASIRLNGLSTAAVSNQVGTLTNAPVAGNPAFWFPVSIAGTVRYVPCW